MKDLNVSFDDLVSILGTQAAVARLFQLSRSAVNQWKELPCIPEGRQWELAFKYPDLVKQIRKNKEVKHGSKDAAGNHSPVKAGDREKIPPFGGAEEAAHVSDPA